MAATTTDPNVRGASLPLADRMSDATMVPRSRTIRWGIALGSFAIAAGLRFLLHPYLPSGYPYITFFPAVALAAFLAGTVGGLAVAGLSLVLSWYYFISPSDPFAVDPQTGLALLLFVIVAVIELGLVHLMRRALRRLAVAEAEARELATSRSLMFAELQHRVSNNLAVISSLLSMQRREVRDPTAAKALEDAASRVQVVSRLSRLLHDPQAQEVDFGAFLREMMADAVQAAGLDDRVAVSVSAEPVTLSAQKAVPLGLVATELVSNALEHGFPDGRRGTVRVSLERVGSEQALLTIRDDGEGLPEGFDIERTRSLGLKIARQFASQIGATLTMSSDGGGVSRLEIPLGT